MGTHPRPAPASPRPKPTRDCDYGTPTFVAVGLGVVTSNTFLLLMGAGLLAISVLALMEQPPGAGLDPLVVYVTSILGGLGLIALAAARWMREGHPAGSVGLRRTARILLVVFLAGYLFDLIGRWFL